MFKRSLKALVLAIFVCALPAFSCCDEAYQAPSSSIATPAPVVPAVQSGHNQNQLINDIWIAAKNTNPWIASGVVAAGVFVMLYSSNESFRKKVRSICGLSDDCPCANSVAKKN